MLVKITAGRSMRNLRHFLTGDLGSRWEIKTRGELEELLDQFVPASCQSCIGANDSDLNTTFGIEDDGCPVKQQSSPRQVAGGPRAENIYKCQLKTLVFTDPDYRGVQFSDDQKARLAAAFPDGVCNWNVPGVGQVPVTPWTTFAAGPGGKPLGSPPVSVAIP